MTDANIFSKNTLLYYFIISDGNSSCFNLTLCLILGMLISCFYV